MKKNIGIVIALVIVAIGGIIYFESQSGKSYQPPQQVGTSPSPVVGAAPKETAPLSPAQEAKEQPIPKGRQTYGVGQAVGTLPRISQVTIDSPDATQGQVQKIYAMVSSDVKVTSVVVTTKTNNKETPVTLTFIAGQYAGQWTMNDADDINYTTTVTATDEKGKKNSVTLTWRNPMMVDPVGVCGQTDGANFLLTGPCGVTNATSGLDGGIFTV